MFCTLCFSDPICFHYALSTAVERVLESASIYEDPIRSALGVAFLAQHGKVVVDEDCQLFPTGNLFGCVANPDPLGIAEDITDHHP